MTRDTMPRAPLVRLAALGAAAMLVATLVGTASASSHGPTLVERVQGLGGQWACEAGTKIEPVADGTYPAYFGTFLGSITIDVYPTANGPEFNFETDATYHVITTVLVKGGPNANLYDYGAGVDSGTALHAPTNPNNDKWYGLSHLCFKTLKK